MRIVCAGGGPAGLYAALLLKKSDPRREVTVMDRNPPGATYGWGVVFSDETLGFLETADPETYTEITRRFVHWQAIDIHYRGRTLRSGGHAFSGLARTDLLEILQNRCRALGVDLQFEREVGNVDDLDADLVLAADGVSSRLRTEHADVFGPTHDIHPTKYIWWGVERGLEAFTFDFRRTQWGMFQVHAYPFGGGLSTCIVECNASAWRGAGLDAASESQSAEFCQTVFAEFLQGRPLLSNRSSWINFVTLRNQTWRHGRIALIGDAAHTAHFSIGSGTKMAMEDAIALVAALDRQPKLDDALIAYEEMRMPIVERTQLAARDSSLWFEHAERYANFDAEQFAFSLLTRSKRITYDNLALRDAGFSDRISQWFAGRSGAGRTRSPLHTPFPVSGLRLSSRAVAMPVLPACADGGTPGEEHRDAIAAKALTRHGLVIAGPLAISPDGRIAPTDLGIHSEAQEIAWRATIAGVDPAHMAHIGCVLAHAGPRGATQAPAIAVDVPLETGEWPLLAASPRRFSPYGQIPRGAAQEDLEHIRDSFAHAASRADRAGFEILGLDFAHGNLLATFLSPLTNHRQDEYGGSVENRIRFPLDVLAAVRRVWPRDRPLFVSYSVSDWHEGGTTEDDAVLMARAFHRAGCDFVQVASGQTLFRSNPVYGRSWESMLADLIRNVAQVPVLVGGNLASPDEANTLLAAGRADLCLMAC